MKSRVKCIILSLVVLIGMLSCQEGVPSGILSKSEMEDVLFELHLAKGIAETHDGKEAQIDEIAYRTSVLNKHGITQAELDSSLVYYCIHTEALNEIYVRVKERLQNGVVANGGDLAMLAGDGLIGDTADVWNQERNFLMMQIAPYNVVSFDIPVDSSFHAGDKYTLGCDVQFVYENGMHDALGLLSMTLSNDSVVSQVAHCTQNGRMNVTISDDKFLGIKALKGYVMQGSSLMGEKNSEMRLLYISNAKLVRMHVNAEAYAEKLRQDSIASARRDSMRTVVMEERPTPALPVKEGVESKE